MRFASFLSGGFITAIVVNLSTGKETGKTHLCAMQVFAFAFLRIRMTSNFKLRLHQGPFYAMQVMSVFAFLRIGMTSNFKAA